MALALGTRSCTTPLIHWHLFGNRLPEQWAPQLTEELQAINTSSAEILWLALKRIAPAFLYEGGCAFDMFLLELALRLNEHQAQDRGVHLIIH